jgi:serine/threonine-protein kinase HipA
MQHAPAQALAEDYVDDGERAFAGQLRDFVMGQAARMTQLPGEAAKIKTPKKMPRPRLRNQVRADSA